MVENDRKLMANIAPFGLRMQPDLKARIEQDAKGNNRSVNAEIVARLEQSGTVSQFLDEFQLLKEANISLKAERDDLQKQWRKFAEIAASAQDINRQLIELLMRKLGVSEDEITAITRPQTKA